LSRSLQEIVNPAAAIGFGSFSNNPETSLCDQERKASAGLAHRRRSLEYVAVSLQTLSFRDRVWRLIDTFKAELPPEGEQDEETKAWRLCLHRIDIRNFTEAERAADGSTLYGPNQPPAQLRDFVEAKRPGHEAASSQLALWSWGSSKFKRGRSDAEAANDWREQLAKAQAQKETKNLSDSERPVAAGGHVFVAAVCVRDYWPEMTALEQEWCAHTIIDAVELDADTEDGFLAAGRIIMDGSGAAALVLPVLFGKSVLPAVESRLLPALAKAVTHAFNEIVSFTLRGVGLYLWQADRSLALTCVQALVTDALASHSDALNQRGRPFHERNSLEAMRGDRRKRLREFIANRGAWNEDEILKLDLMRWPGTAVCQHLLAIATQNPNDPFCRRLLSQCVSALQTTWGREQTDQHYSHESAHRMVDAVCQCALQMPTGEAVVLFAPLRTAVAKFPAESADVVASLILSQANSAPAPTFWAIWQGFADAFLQSLETAKAEHDDTAERAMLRVLFLGDNWGLERDWLPLHGEARRLSALFERLPPSEEAVARYVYYLAKAGTPSLPDALAGLAAKLGSNAGLLNETAIFYLEEILARQIHGGKRRVREDARLRNAALALLDRLVEGGSSKAYKLRDDFVTPY
jgi:hypothetical protein